MDNEENIEFLYDFAKILNNNNHSIVVDIPYINSSFDSKYMIKINNSQYGIVNKINSWIISNKNGIVYKAEVEC